jgi:hypothetical protein
MMFEDKSRYSFVTTPRNTVLEIRSTMQLSCGLSDNVPKFVKAAKVVGKSPIMILLLRLRCAAKRQEGGKRCD